MAKRGKNWKGASALTLRNRELKKLPTSKAKKDFLKNK